MISRKKTNQTRNFWSDKETDTLLKLIKKHRINFSKFKENDDDNMLELIDQMSLRDKAKNMKIDYVK